MAAFLWSIHEARADFAKETSSTSLAYGLAALCWLLSAGVYIAAKWSAAEIPPWTFSFWRVLIAFAILLPLVRHDFGEMAKLLAARWPMLLLIGGLGLAIAQGLMYVAIHHTTLINAGLIMALMPIITMVLARFIVGEAMGPWQVVGAAVAASGTVVIVVKGVPSALLTLHFDAGELLALGAAICFSIYTVLLKRAKFTLPRLPLLVALLGVAVIVSLPLYLYEMSSGARMVIDVKGYVALAYAGIPGGALMYLLYNWSIDALGAGRAGLLMYLQSVFVALLAWLILGEEIEAYHFAGAALIVAGILIVVAFKPRPAAVATRA